MITELREGWTEFRSHTWLWATVIQYALVMMAFNGAFLVLGPVVARTHLGGPAAWGAITAADALGLVGRRPGVAAVHAAQADAVRGRVRRRDRPHTARARAGPAAAGDLPDARSPWGR